ncbi:thimet oligopeptidase-like isoform X2 [Limulus polyphemus]|uniref:Thimet oligopeptidase-like isoform X2 n=1 Tax=Limulus polyphemus TaxID=6850 RepID=A0ABM1S977_LIMPO|nr:thimet oligopeptidase-like isoform X2 [Limulus polyphemus]
MKVTPHRTHSLVVRVFCYPVIRLFRGRSTLNWLRLPLCSVEEQTCLFVSCQYSTLLQSNQRSHSLSNLQGTGKALFKSDLSFNTFRSFSKNILQKHFLPRLNCKVNFFTNIVSGRTTMSIEGVRIAWDLTISPNELLTKTELLISQCRKKYDEVGNLKEEDVNFQSVLKVIADVECEYLSNRYLFDFPQQVSSDKALRDASTEADKKLQAFDVEISMRQDIFDKLLILDKKTEDLKPEYKRYLERLIKMGKRNGLHLSKDIQEKIKEFKNKMNELSIQFNKNLNEENTFLEFTEKELEGLPDDFIDSLEKMDNEKRKITLKYPHYFPTMRKAKNPETRRKMEHAFNSQCISENVPILEELVMLRQKQADLLGFPTHAAYVTELRMAKTAENVCNFLKELATKLKVLWDNEKKYLLELKKLECKELGFEFDEKLNFWDLQYYTTKIEEIKYSVDQDKLREYFPLPIVTKGLLDIYQELLSLKFSLVENAKVWHPDVQMFSVSDSKSNQLLGYFFLDLFPREGKYGHAAMFELQPGCLLPDGSRQISVAAMVANFTKPTANKPSLLDHNEVVTFFHEFGHVMHQICAQANLAHFNGTNVERDFVEAPSQMLENWCWEPVPLRRMSSHYRDETPLPDTMLKSLINSRLANAGYRNLRQIFLGLFDHTIHTKPKVDTREILEEIHLNLLGINLSPNTNFAAHFGHLAGGYDAQYYGYMWSEVFSMDMFYSRFKKEGVMNPDTGRDYREKILQPGGTQDGAEMLHNFLGRDPNQQAFLVSKGIDV